MMSKLRFRSAFQQQQYFVFCSLRPANHRTISQTFRMPDAKLHPSSTACHPFIGRTRGMTDLRLFRESLRFAELRSNRRELSLKTRQALAWPSIRGASTA